MKSKCKNKVKGKNNEMLEEFMEMLPTEIQETKEITKKQKILYSYLKQRTLSPNITTDENGYSEITYDIITKDLGFSRGTIATGLRKLVVEGYIDIIKGNYNDKIPTKYKILDKFCDSPKELKNNELTDDNNNLILQYLKENNDILKEILKLFKRLN